MTANAVAAPGSLVRAKVAGVPSGPAVRFAVTVYVPATVFAVNPGAVATLLALVLTVAVVVLPVKEAPAPLTGTMVKVMLTPTPTGLPPLSVTVAARAVASGAPTGACCGVPALAAMLAGGPGRLVRLKLAGVPSALPVRLATTV